MRWDYETRRKMGLFSSSTGQGRSSAEGGNGHVRDRRAEHRHEAIETPAVKAVRALGGGAPRGYRAKHRAK